MNYRKIVEESIRSVIVDKIVKRIKEIENIVIFIYEKKICHKELNILEELKNKGFHIKAFCPKGTAINFPFDEIIYDYEVKESDLLCSMALVSGLSISDGSQIVNLIEDSFYSRSILKMLYLGVKVYAISGNLLNDNLPNPSIQEKVLNIRSDLKEYGVTFLNSSHKKRKDYYYKKSLLSRIDIVEAARNGNHIRVDKKTIITPYAMDAARDYKVKIIRN